MGKKKKDGFGVHIFVAVPAYDGKVDAPFAQSLCNAAWVAPHYGIEITVSALRNSAFIELARNALVKMFLEEEKLKDCTHLFFVDSDLEFEPGALLGIAGANKPIAAGVYRRRQEPEDYPARWVPDPKEDNSNGIDHLWVEDDWLMCDRVPTGFLCIRRDVLEEMAKDAKRYSIPGTDGTIPWVFHTKDEVGEDGNLRFVGEDFAFCDDYVEKYGEYIPVWPDLTMTHGGYEGNWGKFLLKRVQEAKSVLNEDGQVRKLGQRRKKSA